MIFSEFTSSRLTLFAKEDITGFSRTRVKTRFPLKVISCVKYTSVKIVRFTQVSYMYVCSFPQSVSAHSEYSKQMKRFTFQIWDSMRDNLSSEVCEQHRRRPACASTLSDRRICDSLFFVNYHM